MRARPLKKRPVYVLRKNMEAGVIYSFHHENTGWTGKDCWIWISPENNDTLEIKAGQFMYKDMNNMIYKDTGWVFNSTDKFIPLPKGTAVLSSSFNAHCWPKTLTIPYSLTQ
jgi:hypothetical protein